MPESTTPQLSEDAVREIEARANAASDGVLMLPRVTTGNADPADAEPLPIPLGEAEAAFIRHAKRDTDTLCRALRAAWADVEKFSELADKRHDEVCEARRQRDSLAADFNTHIRDATAALREQLAEAHTWIDRKNAAIESWQQQANQLQSQLAQVENERNELRLEVSRLSNFIQGEV